MENILLYLCGLILVSLYIIMGLDDFIWDILSICRKFRTKARPFDMADVNSSCPKLIAVMIAAWHENNVLGDVIENFMASTIYPFSLYHVFLGVYPNDEATIQVAEALAARYTNVHVVINILPGPTSKAQNINYVIEQIKLFETKHHWKFAAFTVHDSEDVIHPYELKVTNYLIEFHKAVQFPVFPLIKMPSFQNFFQNITTSTYADEFAENHFLSMVNRNNMGGFVPSAGTGFSLTHEVIDSFDDGEVLPNNSLTEDYRLSLTLYEQNMPMYYVLERVPRVNDHLEIVYDYVSTRSMFPRTFSTAVRQKTRWITGITMQSVKLKELLLNKGLKIAGRYTLYKDQKAKVGNLLAFIGYPVLIYFFASFFIDLPPIYPKYTFSWYLCLVVTLMMLERQIFRGISIYQIYGLRSMFFACLFPPLLPFRIIWGNIINFTATIKSYRQKYFRPPGRKRKDKRARKSVKWDKTEHEFLGKHILRRYHRKIGDILIEKSLISPSQLLSALQEIDGLEEKPTLGRFLLEKKLITEPQFLECLAQLTNTIFLRPSFFKDFTLTDPSPYSFEELLEYKVLPLMHRKGELIIAVSEYSSKEILSELLIQEHIQICFAAIENILDCITSAVKNSSKKTAKVFPCSLIAKLFLEGYLDISQALLAKDFSIARHVNENEALRLMGLFELQSSLKENV